MTEPESKPSHAKLQAAARAERLAAELRANLIRRKEKMRAASRPEMRSEPSGTDAKPSD
jgi:hypothetical protein